MAKRKQRHEEHPDERWLITYADVLTLMYVLFMVLFSISVVNTSRFELLKQSLTDAFNSGLAAGGTSIISSAPGTPSPGRGHAHQPDRPRGALGRRRQHLAGVARPDPRDRASSRPPRRRSTPSSKKEGLGGKVSTSVNERGPRRCACDTDGVLFDPGAAVLHVGGRAHRRPDRGVAEGPAQPDPGRGPHRLDAHQHLAVPLELRTLGSARGGRRRRHAVGRHPLVASAGRRVRGHASRLPITTPRRAAPRTAASRSWSCACRAPPASPPPTPWAPADTHGRASSMKKILMIAGPVLLVLAVAAKMFLMPAAPPPDEKALAKEPGPIYTMAEPFVVNLADGDGTPHFAKVGVALRFSMLSAAEVPPQRGCGARRHRGRPRAARHRHHHAAVPHQRGALARRGPREGEEGDRQGGQQAHRPQDPGRLLHRVRRPVAPSAPCRRRAGRGAPRFVGCRLAWNRHQVRGGTSVCRILLSVRGDRRG